MVQGAELERLEWGLLFLKPSWMNAGEHSHGGGGISLYPLAICPQRFILGRSAAAARNAVDGQTWLFLFQGLADFTILVEYRSGRDCHGNPMNCAHFSLRDAFFFGSPGEGSHAGVTTDRHGCSQLNHYRCFGIQDTVGNHCIVKVYETLILIL